MRQTPSLTPSLTARLAARLSRSSRPLLGLLLVAGCSGTGTPGDPIGEWSGHLVTLQGTCPDRAPARLIVGSDHVSFIPSGGVVVLQGKRRSDRARLHAQLMLTDMNKKPLPMVFEGTLAADGTRIDGTFGTPTCRAQVALVRPDEHPLQHAIGN